MKLRSGFAFFCFFLFSNPGLQDQLSIQRTENLYVNWLRYPDSYGEKLMIEPVFQNPIHLTRFAVLLEKQLIDVSKDREAIERFLEHFNNWLPVNKLPLMQTFEDLRDKYTSDVWEIISFTQHEGVSPVF